MSTEWLGAVWDALWLVAAWEIPRCAIIDAVLLWLDSPVGAAVGNVLLWVMAIPTIIWWGIAGHKVMALVCEAFGGGQRDE